LHVAAARPFNVGDSHSGYIENIMTTSNKILGAICSFLTYDNSGSVNWEVSLSAIQKAVDSELAEARRHDATISAALDKLYDAAPIGSSFPTPMVVSVIASELASGNLARMAELSPLVAAFVERSPRFQAKRGRSGGLSRVGG
jgi:hypothetical protein